MAKFLNRELLNKWLDKIIIEAKNELLIIVPYIQTSDRIYSQLIDANNRGVDITMVYKENKLNSHERKKLDRDPYLPIKQLDETVIAENGFETLPLIKIRK
mgnify:CR=1 FL=1